MKTTSDTQETTVRPGTMFSSIVVGIDGSPESREAARQASLLLEDEGELTLLPYPEVIGKAKPPARLRWSNPGYPAGEGLNH